MLNSISKARNTSLEAKHVREMQMLLSTLVMIVLVHPNVGTCIIETTGPTLDSLSSRLRVSTALRELSRSSCSLLVINLISSRAARSRCWISM